MAHTLAILGLILLIGGFSLVVIQPFAAVNFGGISSVNVQCNSSGSCAASASITNVNGTNPLTVWFVVKNSASQTIFVTSQSVTIPAGSSQSVSQPLTNFAAGTYTLNMFIVSYSGVATATYSTQFTVGSFMVVTSPNPDGTTSVAPQGTGACPSSVQKYLFGSSCAMYAPNTQLTLTFTISSSNTAYKTFSCWNIFTINPSTLAATGGTCQKGNPYSFTLTNNIEIQPITNYTAAAYYKQIAPLPALGVTYTPSTTQTVYPPTAGSSYPSSITFTMSASGGFTITGWNLLGSPLGPTLKTGTGTSATIQYSDLSGYSPSNQLYYIQATSQAPAVVSVSSVVGASTNPRPGQYFLAGGHYFNITAYPANGYTFKGWILNGQYVNGSSLNYQFLVKAGSSYVIAPNMVQGSPTGTSTSTSSSGSGGQTSTSSQTSCNPSTFNPSTNAGITVIVTDSRGNPISGATVSGGGLVMTTGSNGVAVLNNIPVANVQPLTTTGSVSVSVSASGFKPTTVSVPVSQGQCTSYAVALSGVFQFGGSTSLYAGIALATFGVLLVAVDLSSGGKRR
jgi:hypothetical protein